MAGAPNTDQLLPDYDDIVYSEPPKTIALYLDATKWIVGLATGSFFLAGTVLAGRPEGGVSLGIAIVAVFFMLVSAACGVRALQCFTRLSNLFEIHVAKKVFEVSVRNNGYEGIRWVTQERKARCSDINAWLTLSNRAYTRMTWLFAIGLALYLVYAVIYLTASKRSSDPSFMLSSAPESPVLGIMRDPTSRSDCIVVRTASGVACSPVRAETTTK